MREVPRHAFVPEPLRPYAYQPQPLPVTPEQNLAAPLLIALMTHLAAVQPDDVVFETGTGAGYQAAVLSLLAAHVYSVEVIEPLAEHAARHPQGAGLRQCRSSRRATAISAGRRTAPYDAMVIKEAIDHVPPPLLSSSSAAAAW